MSKNYDIRQKEMQLLIELGLWPKQLTKPNPTSLERLHRLDLDIRKRQRELYLPEKNANAIFRKALKDYKNVTKRKRKERKEQSQIKRNIEKKKWREFSKNNYLHLGSGVSSWLNDTENNHELITGHNLPEFKTGKALAKFFSVSMKKLAWYVYHREIASFNHYITFSIPKKTGGIRRITMPKSNLASFQRKIKDEILDKLNWQSNIYGFIKGKSAIRNASAHLGARIIINVDIKEFFPSINFPMVRIAFSRLGYSGQISTILALITTIQPSISYSFENKTRFIYEDQRYLPQGACTSPGISNLVATRFDLQLVNRSEKLGYKYSRYADDMTFSSKEYQNIKPLLYMVNKTLELHGFKTNHKKTRILFPHNSQKITGFIINSRTPKIPREWRRNLRASVDQFSKLKTKERNNYNIPQLIGKINYLNLSHPKTAEKYMKTVLELI